VELIVAVPELLQLSVGLAVVPFAWLKEKLRVGAV
jgi:hypothetical protein